MLEPHDRPGALLGEDPHGVLVGEPVSALDGVVVVPAPVVMLLVAQAGGDPALRRPRVGPQRLELGDDQDAWFDAPFAQVGDARGPQHAKGGRQSGRARTNDHGVIAVIR
ncbi:hypothetical protein KXW64_008513, partial [Aspergillus fumigatus]